MSDSLSWVRPATRDLADPSRCQGSGPPVIALAGAAAAESAHNTTASSYLSRSIWSFKFVDSESQPFKFAIQFSSFKLHRFLIRFCTQNTIVCNFSPRAAPWPVQGTPARARTSEPGDGPGSESVVHAGKHSCRTLMRVFNFDPTL